MEKGSKIYVAGHRGLVGSAIVKKLREKSYTNVIGKRHSELDLMDQNAVNCFFDRERPEYVVLAAARVGGIAANNRYRAEFIYNNLQIQNNIINSSYKSGVKKLLFLGSSCIYPRECPQPMREDHLLTSPLEYTNEPYAVAKIAGIKMCESYNIQYGTDYISVMPTNLYGPNDNFDLEKSHVLPALLRKIHLAKLLEQGREDMVLKDLRAESMEEAKKVLDQYGVSSDRVTVWGTGEPMREFLFSEDMADACVYLMESVSFKDLKRINNSGDEIRNTHINIGTGRDISIADLADLIKGIVGFKGEIVFDTEKPDGTYRKLLDVSKLEQLGWSYSTELSEGVKRVYDWYSQGQI